MYCFVKQTRKKSPRLFTGGRTLSYRLVNEATAIRFSQSGTIVPRFEQAKALEAESIQPVAEYRFTAVCGPLNHGYRVQVMLIQSLVVFK